MTEAEAEVWRACTGRESLPTKAFGEAWLVCGRRSGKSFVMALISVYLACFRDYRPFLAVGEKATLMVVAADRRQARQVMRFVRGLLSAPVLAKLVVNDTADSIELAGDAVIEVITASNAVRGYTVAGCCCDELAFWPTEDSATPDQAIIEAIRPSMLSWRAAVRSSLVGFLSEWRALMIAVLVADGIPAALVLPSIRRSDFNDLISRVSCSILSRAAAYNASAWAASSSRRMRDAITHWPPPAP